MKICSLITFLFLFAFSTQTQAQGQSDLHQKVRNVLSAHSEAIRTVSAESGFPVHTIVAFVAVESGGKQGCSSKGACGIMQTRPVANKATGIQCRTQSPLCQIRQGVGYLKHLRSRYGLSFHHVAYAYNHGPGNERKASEQRVLQDSYVKMILAAENIARTQIGF